MDEMLHHCRAVARGAKIRPADRGHAFHVLPGSRLEEAVRNAGRFLQQGGMEAVKLEGGGERAGCHTRHRGRRYPGDGTSGFDARNPSTLLGGFRPQGRKQLPPKGCSRTPFCSKMPGVSALVLESVPGKLAEMVSKRISIPTIGIGAGVGCDGQVLGYARPAGIVRPLHPQIRPEICQTCTMKCNQPFQAFITDVQEHKFPAKSIRSKCRMRNGNFCLNHLKL